MSTAVHGKTITNAKTNAKARKSQASKTIEKERELVERQLESPMNALINQREPLFLDELPEIQRETPLNALINRRDPLTLAEAAGEQMEYALNAQTNGREPLRIDEIPGQLESPVHALINGRTRRLFWNLPKKKKNP